MPTLEARPAVVERTRPPRSPGATVEYGGGLHESGFGRSIPALPVPDVGSQAGGPGAFGEVPAHGGGCACELG